MSGHFGEPQGSRLPARSSTMSSITPSGEDANPLNRRLPAEVVTRQRRETKKPAQEKPTEEVTVDLRTALALKPDARPKWLGRAFKMVEEGKATTNELYDILTSRKFAAGIHVKVGRKLHVIAIENVELFSEKQQRYFRSDEWQLSKYASDKADELQAFERNDDKDDKDDDRDPVAPSSRRSADAVAPIEEKTVKRSADPVATSRVPKRLAGAFEMPAAEKENKRERTKREEAIEEVKREKERSRKEATEETQGGWVSLERDDTKKAQDAAKKAKKEAFDRANLLHQETQNAMKRELQQQQAKKKQVEEEADSSLDLLERLNQQKQRRESPEPEKKSRRNGSKDRDRDRDRDRDKKDRGKDRDRDRDGGRRKRGMSRSRSISIQAASPSRSRGRDRKRKRGGGGGESIEELIRQRMAQRDREVDSSRIPVVDPGHAARWL